MTDRAELARRLEDAANSFACGDYTAMDLEDREIPIHKILREAANELDRQAAALSAWDGGADVPAGASEERIEEIAKVHDYISRSNADKFIGTARRAHEHRGELLDHINSLRRLAPAQVSVSRLREQIAKAYADGLTAGHTGRFRNSFDYADTALSAQARQSVKPIIDDEEYARVFNAQPDND